MAKQDSTFHAVVLVCLVATLSYFAARLGGALIIRPQMVSPLWLANVLLVAMLLLVRRKMRPVLLAAGLAAFFLYDLQSGVPIRAIGWLVLSNTVEVLTAILCLSYSFGGVPRLNSMKALAKYSFYAVFLAPFAGALPGALSTGNNYWASWKIAFFSEALGFLTLMPALLGWAKTFPTGAQKPRAYYVEAAVLFGALVLLGNMTFVTPEITNTPALIYSFVPLLLWSALRFGSTGVSTSMILIAFQSIWGAVHGRGPFVELAPFINVLSLQLFLFFTAAPFMALAVLVEERKETERVLRQRDAELAKAHRLAQLGSWHWDPVMDIVTWSTELHHLAGCDRELPRLSFKDHEQFFTPESWIRLSESVERSLRTGEPYVLDLEGVRPDGTRLWLTCRGEAVGDASSRITQLRGTIQNITYRKRAEQSLRESENRFRQVANSAPVLIWMSDPDKFCTFFNQSWLDFTGRPLEQESEDGWGSGLHPEDWKRCFGIYTTAFDSRVEFEMEYKLRRFDGEYRWVIDRGVPRFDAGGTFLGYIGSAIDITDRKLSEAALRDMGGRLIHAHEEERARIARELHDDLSQRLALLQIGLEQFEQSMPRLSSEARKQLHGVAQTANEVSSDIHNLSHQLHPSNLGILSLVRAVGTFCRELSKQHSLQIEFVHHDVPAQVSKDVSLCLFRIVQEALRNVLKHSGVREANVELIGRVNCIDLSISDRGVGFNAKSENGNTGLGLISMRERLRLIGGNFSVESEPAHGTRIRARVPLPVTENESHVSERQTT